MITMQYKMILYIYLYNIPQTNSLGHATELRSLRSAPDGPGHEFGLQRPPPQRRCHRDGRIRRSRQERG